MGKYSDIQSANINDISLQNRFVLVSNPTYAEDLAGSANPSSTAIGQQIDAVGAIAFVPDRGIIYSQGARYGVSDTEWNEVISSIQALQENTNGDVLVLGQSITGTGVDGNQVQLGTDTTPISDALQDIWNKILQVDAVAASGAAGVSSITFTGASQNGTAGNVTVTIDGSTVNTKAATTGATTIAAGTSVDSALNTLDNAIASANAGISANSDAIATANSRIAAAEGAINTLNGDATTTGSVANSVKTAVDAEAEAREDADDALSGRIDDLEAVVEANEIKLYKEASGSWTETNDVVSANGTEYRLIAGKTATSNGTTIASFNIAHDMVVSGGEVTSFATGASLPTGVSDYGVEYLHLTIANGDDVYIPVRSLVDVYTANNQSSNPVQLSIDSNKNITGDLSDAVKASLSLADSALQPTGAVTSTADLINMIESANATVTGSEYITVSGATGSEGEINYTVSANTGSGKLALYSDVESEAGIRAAADSALATMLTGTPSGSYSPSGTIANTGNVQSDIAALESAISTLQGQILQWIEIQS